MQNTGLSTRTLKMRIIKFLPSMSILGNFCLLETENTIWVEMNLKDKKCIISHSWNYKEGAVFWCDSM